MGATAADVISSFEGLSDTVQLAVYRELGTPIVPSDPATPNEIAEFRATDHGRLVISEWRDDVPRRLGIIFSRWERLTSELSDEEFAEIDRYFREGLQPHERAAVLRRLAA